MSLLSEYNKARQLPRGGLKLPPPQVAEPVKVEMPPEDPDYSRLVSINPILGELVDTLGLVHIKPRGPKIADSYRLSVIAGDVFTGENSYTQEEAIERIREVTKVNQERAERGFKLMEEAGAIERTPAGSYFLAGSTPF